VKVLLYPVLPDITKGIALFEGPQASPAYLSDKSSVRKKMSMANWRIIMPLVEQHSSDIVKFIILRFKMAGNCFATY
jgi:hypothetical protein